MGRSAFSALILEAKLPETAAAIALLSTGLAAQPANTLLLERWDGITGAAVSNLTTNANYPGNPTSRSYPTLFEIPSNAADNYGTRVRGYITPPTAGNYTFWISGDDNCELWLGTSDDTASIRRIAYVTGWTNSREWAKYPEQQSTPIALSAGVRYFVETRHKEGTGGDHMAVGWQGPGITGDAERPIPGSRLAPFVFTGPAAKTVLLERWDGISGTTVSSLTSSPNYPGNPTSRSWITGYEIPLNVADNYGTRTRGYVTPPTTGNYTFWISGDDNCELWLGTSGDPATARQIASVPEWTNSREWTKYGQQQSAAIALTGGTRYYIETRHKEGTGGDNMAVGWQGPGITGDAERPIPGGRLEPFALGTPPAITTQPGGQTVNVGQTATFTVAATGSAPLAYQWRRNGTDIPGASSASYTTPAAVAADNGAQFSVRVSNGSGSVISANAILTVNVPPSITAQPVPQTVVLGQTATFTVTAAGTAPLSYQWRRNGVNIAGAISPAYTTPATVETDNGAQFTVVVTNPFGVVTSGAATLTVNIPPGIVTPPADQTVNLGQTATFSAVISGTPPFTYQWRRNGTPITGANAPTYTTPPTTSSDNGALFSVVVTNPFGTVISSNAVLTVSSAPVITTQPVPRTVNAGQTATFSVVAGGSAPLSYQWRRNGVGIVGATSASYTTPPTTAADNGAEFSVVVSNSQGSVASANALLTVLVPPSITTQPAAQTVNLGQTATFTVAAAGSTPLSYQWRRNGTAITGATSASYTTPPAALADDGALYSVVVSNAAGSIASADARLTVLVVATNSRKVAVSGELVDASGNPLGYPAPVTVDAVVRLYGAATGGTALYTEEFRAAQGKAITVANGLFVARLGEGTSSQNLQQVVVANSDLWVEITIDDGTPDVLVPRTPLTASAYSLGVTPTPAAAPALSGSGDPNAAGVEGAVGATYVDNEDNSTWFKLKNAWKRMD